MARIRGYIAVSLDGYIADLAGRLDWLSHYEGMELGEHGFAHLVNAIGTVVMGRDTYDFVAQSSLDWPYAGKRAIVVTSRPLHAPVGDVALCSDIDDLVRTLRSLEDGDVWVVGGGKLQAAFIQRGELDQIEIFMIPELIGGGVPLFPAIGIRASLRLLRAKPLDRGCVYLRYGFSEERPVLKSDD